MKICLDLHDFSVVNNRLDLLLKLKEIYPGFKISLFTVPIDERMDWGPYIIRPDLLKLVKENLDWIQIIPHGLNHNSNREMLKYNYEEFRYKVIPAIKEAFDKDGLPFVKGFCAPHWRWNKYVVKALDDEGWFGSIDPRQPNMLSTKKFFRYSHPIDEPLTNANVLKLHGHV
ncbi:MAG: hypothetical protein Q8L27_02460 [archaeon]|nr:hypothetical protein [archaeon]